MKLFSIVVCVAYGLIASGLARGESKDRTSKEIPLKSVWAFEMPGTKDVKELEPKLDVRDPKFKDTWERSLVRQIGSLLSSGAPRGDEIPRPGFVVVGVDKEALQKAQETLKDKYSVEWQQQLPKDTELSLVFFHYVTGWHPQLTSVEQSAESIVVKYKFVNPKEPSFGAARFAIIPLGKLSPGIVEVKFEEQRPVDYRGLPTKEKTNSEQLVCSSFSFVVK